MGSVHVTSELALKIEQRQPSFMSDLSFHLKGI